MSQYTRAPVILLSCTVATWQKLTFTCRPVAGTDWPPGPTSVPSCVPRPTNSVTTVPSSLAWLLTTSTLPSENAPNQPCQYCRSPSGPVNRWLLATSNSSAEPVSMLPPRSTSRALNASKLALTHARPSAADIGPTSLAEMPVRLTRRPGFRITARSGAKGGSSALAVRTWPNPDAALPTVATWQTSRPPAVQ